MVEPTLPSTSIHPYDTLPDDDPFSLFDDDAPFPLFDDDDPFIPAILANDQHDKSKQNTAHSLVDPKANRAPSPTEMSAAGIGTALLELPARIPDDLFTPSACLLPFTAPTPTSSTRSCIDWTPWKERLLASDGNSKALTALAQEIQRTYEQLSIAQIKHLASARLSEWRRRSGMLPPFKPPTISWKHFPGLVEDMTENPSSISSWIPRIQTIYPLPEKMIIAKIYSYMGSYRRRPPSSLPPKCLWEPHKDALLKATSNEEILAICTKVNPTAKPEIMLKNARNRIYDWERQAQALARVDRSTSL